MPSLKCPNVCLKSNFLPFPLLKRNINCTDQVTTVSREPGHSVLVFLTFSQLFLHPNLSLYTGVLLGQSLLILFRGARLFLLSSSGDGTDGVIDMS